MKPHRTIIPIVGLLMALSAAGPAAAPANPLLSGYGGPGQGSQAILGSALLNGPGSGRGGGSGNASSSTPAASGSQTTGANPAPAATTQGRRASSGGSPRAGTEGGERGAVGQSSPSVSVAYPASERGAAALQSGALGLSGEDLLFIILALFALAFTGGLTRRLTRTTAAGRPGS
jgi:hypothetical protein